MKVSFLPVALLLALSACSSAAERHQSAVVRLASEGQPCFAVEDNAETRGSAPRVAVVDLYERREGAATLLWETSFVPEQGGVEKRLPVGECIAYPGGKAADAPVLTTGKAYSVTIWAFVDRNGESHRRWYTGYFCLVETSGDLRVQQVLAEEVSDAAGWAECGVRVDR